MELTLNAALSGVETSGIRRFTFLQAPDRRAVPGKPVPGLFAEEKF